MGDSVMGSDWGISEAKNKIAALSPKLATMHRTFLLGAASLIWYKDPLIRCVDRCKFNVSLRFPSQNLNQNLIGVVGFKFKTPKE